ncbi:MAG: MotA/TolQ/ExbB proton channel family protein [Arenibacterium sp.]
MNLFETMIGLLALGGPVVAILLLLSVVTMAVTLYKFWQFSVSGVGRHRVLREALDLWDSGDISAANDRLAKSRSYLAAHIGRAMSVRKRTGVDERLDTEVAQALAVLERGFRMLDTIAQIAPLLGLFGTVLGMINAFQSLQSAGSTVDPSVLAGGIWVALLTTAVGLAVAIPTSMVLTWFESRMARERIFADKALRTVFVPDADSQESYA